MFLIKAFGLALGQISDPKFQKVLAYGVLAAALAFTLVMLALIALVPLIPDTGFGWLDSIITIAGDLGAVLFSVIAGYVFFPAVSTLFMSLFLDEIVTAVEQRHYPAQAAPERSRLFDELLLGLRFAAFAILVNLLILPIYLGLLITGVGSLVTALLFLIVNGVLLGREFFEMVAVRHLTRPGVAWWRKARKDEVFACGLLIAGLFLLPLLNLLAPVLGAATMTHVFHHRPLPPAAMGRRPPA